jgi:hypothetical protein
VTIGGQAADVTNVDYYDRTISGPMLGPLQINAIVPTGTSTGAAVSVMVTIGGNSLQAGVASGVHSGKPAACEFFGSLVQRQTQERRTQELKNRRTQIRRRAEPAAAESAIPYCLC